jgi:hypothetical protein
VERRPGAGVDPGPLMRSAESSTRARMKEDPQRRSWLGRHQSNFPIALAEAIPLNVWKLGLAPVSRQ